MIMRHRVIPVVISLADNHLCPDEHIQEQCTSIIKHVKPRITWAFTWTVQGVSIYYTRFTRIRCSCGGLPIVLKAKERVGKNMFSLQQIQDVHSDVHVISAAIINSSRGCSNSNMAIQKRADKTQTGSERSFLNVSVFLHPHWNMDIVKDQNKNILVWTI